MLCMASSDKTLVGVGPWDGAVCLPAARAQSAHERAARSVGAYGASGVGEPRLKMSRAMMRRWICDVPS